jgi:Domain of Unknown Function (DUF1080)
MSSQHLSRRSFLNTSAAALTIAQAAITTRAFAAPADGWIELFDGKTLAGWHKNPMRIGHGTGGNWQVEEGAITGEQDPPGSGNGGILLTDRKFSDFELLIDLKPDWGICSGLFLRSNDRGQCLQMMVDYHDAGNVGQIYGEGLGGFNTRTFDINGKLDADKKLVGFTTDKHRTSAEAGLIAACTPEQWINAWKVNDWNTARVICTGKYANISTWINGQKICEFDSASSTAARLDKDKVIEQIGLEGSIAVQVHGGMNWPSGAKCRWRNIRARTVT